MSKSTDHRGRIYLPKDIRERFGDRYRIVELPSHVALFPVDEDPLDGLRAAVGEAFAETTADEVNYPCLLAAVGGSLRRGLPASTTRFAGTVVVPAESAVSTGISSE
jgi:hypothetical protein